MLRLKRRPLLRLMIPECGTISCKEWRQETILSAAYSIISIQPATVTDSVKARSIPALLSTAICMRILSFRLSAKGNRIIMRNGLWCLPMITADSARVMVSKRWKKEQLGSPPIFLLMKSIILRVMTVSIQINSKKRSTACLPWIFLCRSWDLIRNMFVKSDVRYKRFSFSQCDFLVSYNRIGF